MVRIALMGFTMIPAIALAVDIAACGQEVAAGEVAELRGHLSCGGRAVSLTDKATLNMNGFTIQGSGVSAGVECPSRKGCTVNGPGDIRGFDAGITGAGRIRIDGVTLTGNKVGATSKGGFIDIARAVASGNDVGLEVQAGRLRGVDVQANGNARAGVWTLAARTKLVRVVAVENGDLGGIHTSRPRSARIVESTALDNNGLGQGYDVLTTGRVRLVDSVCGLGAKLRVTRDPGETVTVIGQLRCQND